MDTFGTLTHLAIVAPTPFFDLHRSFAESDMAIFDGWARTILYAFLIAAAYAVFYRVVLAVFLMPLAGLAIARLADWARRRRVTPIAAALAIGLSVGALAHAIESRMVFADGQRSLHMYRPVEF